MEIKQCEFCRAPYQSTGNRLCGDCLLQLDEDFILIREYLYDNDGAGIEEVSEATGVTRKTIMYLLKEERLIVGDEKTGAGGILTCESCKKPISTGRICAGCKKEVLTAIQQSVGPVSKPKRRQVIEETEEDPRSGMAKLQLKGR